MEKPTVHPRLLLLISRQTTDREQSNKQYAIQNMLKASNLDEPEIIDGADAENKQRRDDLFAVSGLRAKYPQV